MIDFDNIHTHGFARAAVCIPHVRVADPAFNLRQTLSLARRAADAHAGIVLFPELGLSSYSADDLFHQDALLDATAHAVARLVEESTFMRPVLLVGAALRFENKLFNCAVVVHRGRILGIVPKTYLPNYREFYEKRQFTPASDAAWDRVRFMGHEIPFGNDLLFDAVDFDNLVLHAEICEDLWVPIPPSTIASMAGATVLANLSASNITIGKAEYRRDLCASQSGRCIAAYLYAAAGPGESTTDLAWDGHAMIWENNELLAESERFSGSEQLILADVDLERLAQDRMRMTSFNDAVGDHRHAVRRARRVEFELGPPDADRVPLVRTVDRFPYVPNDPAQRDARCFEAYNIQMHGLLKRLQATGIQRTVIGVSGGLDSTQALLVAARTMDRLGLPRTNILAYTLPGFATSSHTYDNAWALMRSLGVTAGEIDIRPSSMQMMKDIGHPFAEGREHYDVTFENVQAGERTSHLFRLANEHDALVLGTSDLSELALGWTTYGVGDQMSHYNVNASVPKTLIQYLIDWEIHNGEFAEEASDVLQSILRTEISPELIPSSDDGTRPTQRTEAVIGPYELQDFNLYYITRYGFRPTKVAYLALHAWGDRQRGSWPDDRPIDERHEYDLDEIVRWLEVFLRRFFKTSQFKRSAMPNGPKVGSGGSLSPRGDWRAPSDSEATAWLDALAAIQRPQ